MNTTTDYLAEAITEAFGVRCRDSHEDCHCCRAWRQYDDVASLRSKLEEAEGALLSAADAVTNPVNTSTELTVLKADIDEFMRRLGPRWFLEQGWFPETVNATLASLREADHAS